MQFDIKAFHTKPPSLEEGPMKRQANSESYAINLVDENMKYRRCIDIIKVLLYLELTLFVGWIGLIFLSNYYTDSSHKSSNILHDQPKWTNDLHKDDFSVNSKSVPEDDIVKWHKDTDAIASTERSENPTTTVMAARNEFVETETTESSSKTETEGSYEDISIWKFLNIPIIDDDMKNGTVEEKNSSVESKSDSPKEKIILTHVLGDSQEVFPDSGLIHVIDDHVSDMNDGVSFPRFYVEKYKIASTAIPTGQDESTIDKSKVDWTKKPFNDDLEIPPVIFSSSTLRDWIEDHDSDIKRLPFPQLNWKDNFQDEPTIYDGFQSSEESLRKDIDQVVLNEDQIQQDLMQMFFNVDGKSFLGDVDSDSEYSWNHDSSEETMSELKAKRSTENSSSEEKTEGNKSKSSESLSSEEKTTKD